MVLGVVRLLEKLLGEGGHEGLCDHKQVVAAEAPLCELVLLEARVESALRFEWLVLVRHFRSLFFEVLARLFLLSEFLGRLALRSFASVLAIARVTYVVRRVAILLALFIAIDYGA